jgi:hypothetical protein
LKLNDTNNILSRLVSVLEVLLLNVLLLGVHHLTAEPALGSDRSLLLHCHNVSGATNGRFLFLDLRTARPVVGVGAAHLPDVARVRLMLLELRGRDLVHAKLAWLQGNAVVVHYHFWLKRLIDKMSISLAHAAQVVGIE